MADTPFYKLPNPSYHFDNEHELIIQTKTHNVVGGLLASLKSKFYPNYSYETATIEPPKEQQEENKKQKKQQRKNSKNEMKYRPVTKYARTKRGAMARGSRVDNQFGKVVELLKADPQRTLKDLLDGNVRGTKSIIAKFNPHTKSIMAALHEKSLYPLESQYCVGFGNRGTMIDLICQRLTDGALVACEIKTGNHRRDYHHTGHRLESPFHKYSDCLAAQYQLQLAGGIAMYNKTIRKSAHHKLISDGYVIKANVARYENEVEVTRLLSDFFNNMDKILEIICA